MANSSQHNPLTKLQKIILTILSVALAFLLLIFRNGLSSTNPLDELARRSLSPEVALANNKPTIIEFYADWCEVCQQMAPSMISVEKLNKDKLDIVLLNVDNEKWLDLISFYGVNGIPQMNFFDEFGDMKGKSIGFRTFEEIKDISDALISNNQLPLFNSLENLSARELESSTVSQNSRLKTIKPRSHG